jgi:hypothetical protein
VSKADIVFLSDEVRENEDYILAVLEELKIDCE